MDSDDQSPRLQQTFPKSKPYRPSLERSRSFNRATASTSSQAHEYKKYAHLLDQSFRPRKKVFADRLGRKVSVSVNIERDSYDRLHPAYLMWCDQSQIQLYGSVRLMPTTGPTLLYDVFRETFPQVYDLVAPGIWERTRMCIDEEAVERDFPDMRPERALCLLLLALCEVALDNGIDTLISNYEPHMRRIYEPAGAELDELGRADGYGRFPVCCGAFEVYPRVLTQMRLKTKVAKPLYRRPAFSRSHIDLPEVLPA